MAKTQDESNELYESIMETLEILSDAEVMAALHEGAEAIARGETVPWDDVKRELGLDDAAAR